MAITKATASSIAPAAKGDLVAGTATNDAAVLAVGANDTVLTADSAEATGLKWATASSGGMTLISTTTFSGATTVLSSIPQIYNDLRVVIRQALPANDDSELLMRLNNDSNENRHQFLDIWESGVNQAFDRDKITLNISADNAVTQSLTVIDISDYTNTATWKMSFSRSMNNSSTTTTNVRSRVVMGFYNQTSAISSLGFFWSSGNATSGSILLYGVK